MGSLLKDVPFSEVVATLEVLAQHGVERRHLDLIRSNPERASEVAQTIIAGYVLVKPAKGEVFGVWQTIKLGTGHQTADDFRKALEKSGCKIGNWANDILGKPAFTAATEETEVDLVNISAAELGFLNGATRKEIYQKAIEFGLELCPPEVGPQLRLQYKAQPNGKWFLIGMEPITDSDGYLSVFRVGRDDSDLWLGGGYGSPDEFWSDDDLWLGGGYGDPDRFWHGHDRWVFVRRPSTRA